MNVKAKNILERAIKNGFDLSGIENYNEKLFINKLYDYLVKNKYFCMLEENMIIVADYTLEDIVEIKIEGYHLNVFPLKTDGFFDVLIDIFRFIADNQNLKPEEEISTEEVITNEIDSEDLDWI